jgi:hypothetical protein
VGVLVVVAFVTALTFGGRPQAAALGERVAVGRADAAGTLAVFVPRCRDERVEVVEIAEAGGVARWRIASRKGSIDERYVVGADAPLGFEVEVPLDAPLPEGELTATVAVDGDGDEVRDRAAFRVGAVPEEDVLYRGQVVDIASFQARALSAAWCPESRTEFGFTTVVFGLGALLVVGSYGLMVSRWWRGRGTA